MKPLDKHKRFVNSVLEAVSVPTSGFPMRAEAACSVLPTAASFFANLLRRYQMKRVLTSVGVALVIAVGIAATVGAIFGPLCTIALFVLWCLGKVPLWSWLVGIGATLLSGLMILYMKAISND